MLVVGGKLENPEKNPRSLGREPTKDATHRQLFQDTVELRYNEVPGYQKNVRYREDLRCSELSG